MNQVIFDKTDSLSPIKVWGDIEPKTLEQIKNVAALPFIFRCIALAPDNHPGDGIPIGSIIPCSGYVIPNAVGSDIGCGMSAIPLGIPASDFSDKETVTSLFEKLMEVIPVGIERHGVHDLDGHARSDRYSNSMFIANKLIESKSYDALCSTMRGPVFETILTQMGTLGDGNHFFELQKDANDMLWFMVHSGSRNLGAMVCKLHLKIAQDMCERYHSKLEDKSLAYLHASSPEGKNYIEQMNIALKYAYLNREEMIRQALQVLEESFGYVVDMKNIINIHHNYATIENHYGKNVWVHRKGATCARKGMFGIIPGSMCTKSYIVRGLGCEDSLTSCSHGSGRNFSRTEARKRIEDGTDAPILEQLGDVLVFGSTDYEDEGKSAYKDVENVMANQEDLVEIVEELIPIAVLKG